MKKSLFLTFLIIGILFSLTFPVLANQVIIGTPVTVTGELTVLYVDDFDQKVGKVLYHLKDSNTGKVFNLSFSGPPPGKLKTGSIVTVHGKVRGNVLYLAGGQQAPVETVVAAAPSVVGEQKTIVIVADFLDQNVSCAVPDIQNLVFTDPLSKSVDDLYQEMSFGQLWLTGGVAGPYLINYGTTSSCNISAWADAADAAAQSNGINIGAYNRKIYVMPSNNPCGYIGVGTVGGNPSRSWIFRCAMNDAYAHEFGHNLGMNHASTPSDEYGDVSDIMGYSGIGLRQLNGPHQDQMGWLDPLQIEGIVESGTYNIAPIELSSTQTVDPQVFMISKPDTGESYYLSYRQPLEFDSSLSSTYTGGVNIHRHKTDSATRTYLLAVLSDGGSFTDSVNEVTVTQVGHTDQYVTVEVQLISNPSCVMNVPTMSLSPAGQSAQAGTALAYSVMVTNMDSTACGQATFSLAASLPGGWTGTVSPAAMTLAPGATGTATLSATSPGAAAAGDYPITLNVSDGATATHAASRTVTYTVLPPPACVSATPQIRISPSSQTGQAGSTLGYSVSVTNKDNAYCQQTTFTLSRSIPPEWAGAFSPASLTLAPGASGSSTLSITSTTSAAVESYGITATASDAAVSGHTASVNATYAVIGDRTPPSPPAALTAKSVRGKVNLSWAASTDNVGVSGYKVWRNNVVIGQTSGIGYSDSSVTAGQTYTYYVTAFDAAGNPSGPSNTVNVTITGGKKK